MRHTEQLPDYNDDLLAWLLRAAPRAASLFELRRVGFQPKDPARYALFLPWLQDPLREELPEHYAQAKRVEDAILSAGGAVVNPVDQLSNSIKSVASARLRAAGVPMPRVAPLSDTGALRRDSSSRSSAGGPVSRRPMHPLAPATEELAKVPWDALRQPVVGSTGRSRGTAPGAFASGDYVVVGYGARAAIW